MLRLFYQAGAQAFIYMRPIYRLSNFPLTRAAELSAANIAPLLLNVKVMMSGCGA